MIDPVDALRVARRELRDTVAPALPDGYVKEQLIAVVGILGEVAGRVHEDDGWYRSASVDLRAELDVVSAMFPAGTEPSYQDEQGEQPDARAEHARLLGRAERLFDALWSRSAEPWATPARDRLRAAIAADLAAQLGRGQPPGAQPHRKEDRSG